MDQAAELIVYGAATFFFGSALVMGVLLTILNYRETGRWVHHQGIAIHIFTVFCWWSWLPERLWRRWVGN